MYSIFGVQAKSSVLKPAVLREFQMKHLQDLRKLTKHQNDLDTMNNLDTLNDLYTINDLYTMNDLDTLNASMIIAQKIVDHHSRYRVQESHICAFKKAKRIRRKYRKQRKQERRNITTTTITTLK